MPIPKFILATAAAGGLALFTGGVAGTSSTGGASAKSVLDQLCEDRGGIPVYTRTRLLVVRALAPTKASTPSCRRAWTSPTAGSSSSSAPRT